MTAYRNRRSSHGSKKRQHASTRVNPTPQAERIDKLLEHQRTHQCKWRDSSWEGQERCNCGEYRRKQPCSE